MTDEVRDSDRPGGRSNMIGARDAGPYYSTAEWLRRMGNPHIEPGLPVLGETPMETALKKKIVTLETRIAELERERKVLDERLGGLVQIEGEHK